MMKKEFLEDGVYSPVPFPFSQIFTFYYNNSLIGV